MNVSSHLYIHILFGIVFQLNNQSNYLEWRKVSIGVLSWCVLFSLWYLPSSSCWVMLQEILKNVIQGTPAGLSRLADQALVGMAGLFLSHEDFDSELQNLSTQLTKFPLVGCHQACPVLQNSHDLLECTSGKPRCFYHTFLSGTQLSHLVKENTTQT